MTNHNHCLLFLWPGLLGLPPPSRTLTVRVRPSESREMSPKKIFFFGGLGVLCLFQICQCYMLRNVDKKFETFRCGNFQSTFIRNKLIGSANARSRSSPLKVKYLRMILVDREKALNLYNEFVRCSLRKKIIF